MKKTPSKNLVIDGLTLPLQGLQVVEGQHIQHQLLPVIFCRQF